MSPLRKIYVGQVIKHGSHYHKDLKEKKNKEKKNLKIKEEES